MHGKLIHKSAKFNPEIVWTDSCVFKVSIVDIIFSEGNTKAGLIICGNHIFDGIHYTVEFSKENGIWTKIPR